MRRANPWMLVLTLLAPVATGCVDDERFFYIIQNQEPGDGCKVPLDEGAIARAAGTLDVMGGYGYRMFPLIKNTMTSTTTGDKQPERNRLVVRRFEIELDLSELPPFQGCSASRRRTC